MPKTKKESAEKFLAELVSMETHQLQKLLDAETDRDLIQFFREYAAFVIQKNSHQPDKAAFLLILAGYLIRDREEKNTVWLSPKGDA